MALSIPARNANIDYATLTGIACAFGLVLLAIVLGGNFLSYLDFESALIVLGGTVGATLITFPLEDFQKTFEVLRPALFPDHASARHRMDKLLEFAKVSRAEGGLSLETYAFREPDPFFRKCLELVVDQVPKDDIKRILDIELSFLEDRHRRGAQILQTMGAVAPAMGLIGTLIGLVRMLQNLHDPSQIGPGMAVAILTTFYGALLAYVVFLPLAAKLRMRSEEEQLIKELTIEGALCIVDGLNPRIIEQRLQSFLPPGERHSQFE